MTVNRQYRSRILLAAPALALGLLVASPGLAAAGGPGEPGGGEPVPGAPGAPGMPNAPGIPGAPAAPSGPVAGALGSIQDDANVLGDLGPIKAMAAGLPFPVCVWTTNQSMPKETFDQAVHGRLGPSCPGMVGYNADGMQTSVQFSQESGVPVDKAATAAGAASSAFTNSMKDHSNNVGMATDSALSSIKNSLAGIPGLGALGSAVAPAPGIPTSVNMPNVAAPPAEHHWYRNLWWWLIPLVLLCLAGIALARWLRGDTRRVVVDPPVKRTTTTTAYTAPTARTAMETPKPATDMVKEPERTEDQRWYRRGESTAGVVAPEVHSSDDGCNHGNYEEHGSTTRNDERR